MLEYNYSWRNGPQQPAPQVHISNRTTFNDYLQTGLLAANLIALEDVRQLLQEAATARKLQWWESVVRHRFPVISDPMTIRESAETLMAWDQRETAAQRDRLTGKQDRYFRYGWNIWVIFVALACALVSGLFVLAIVWFIAMIVNDNGNTEEAATIARRAVVLFWIPWGVLIAHQVWKMFTGYPPAFDPAAKSVICRQFRPGQRITSLSGQTYTVRDWPIYRPERLFFWIPVDRATGETVSVWQAPGLECDKVVWHR